MKSLHSGDISNLVFKFGSCEATRLLDPKCNSHFQNNHTVIPAYRCRPPKCRSKFPFNITGPKIYQMTYSVF